MRVAAFSTKRYDREFLETANRSVHEFHFFEPHLDAQTVALATGFDAVCVFVKIGAVVAKLLRGFDCTVLPMDPYPNSDCQALGVRYVSLDEVLECSDLISLHCPLTPENHHLINAAALARVKEGAMLINTSRGALVDTIAVIEALKSRKLGYLGLDVYRWRAAS